jgi:hypothetical protein
MLAGSNPNGGTVNTSVFPTYGNARINFILSYMPCSEYRVEYLNPPYMSVARPKIIGAPAKILYNTQFAVNVTIPANLEATNIKGTLTILNSNFVC